MIPRITCRELIEFLDDYVDGSLAVAERERFDDHLGRCAPCVRYLRGYQGTLRAVALAARGDEPPAGDVPNELIAAILAARRAS